MTSWLFSYLVSKSQEARVEIDERGLKCPSHLRYMQNIILEDHSYWRNIVDAAQAISRVADYGIVKSKSRLMEFNNRWLSDQM